MNKKNKGTGAGGAKTNVNGLNFEKRICLKKIIENAKYKLVLYKTSTKSTSLYEVMKNNKLIAYYGQKGQIYNALKIVNFQKFNNQYVKKVFSKKFLPDDFILSLKPRRLTIFEKKWQGGNGSVDEKIQTAPFKLAMFEKLLRGSGIGCQYHYLLNEWYQNKKYRNVKEYYENNKKINIFTENENLSKLNIDDYLK